MMVGWRRYRSSISLKKMLVCSGLRLRYPISSIYVQLHINRLMVSPQKCEVATAAPEGRGGSSRSTSHYETFEACRFRPRFQGDLDAHEVVSPRPRSVLVAAASRRGARRVRLLDGGPGL